MTGLDVSGIVVEVGHNVDRIKVGDAVFGMTNNFSGDVLGTYAEIKEKEVAKAPTSMSLVEAASITLAAQTALQALRDICRLEQGKKILITGAGGGVGHFAIQIARHIKAEVHGICGTNNIEYVSSLIAHYTYDYKKNNTVTGNKYDAAFDAAGRYNREYFSGQLGKNGIYVTTVPNGRSIFSELMARLKISKKNKLVFVRSSYKDLGQLSDWVNSGVPTYTKNI